jgi:hypothetical protein
VSLISSAFTFAVAARAQGQVSILPLALAMTLVIHYDAFSTSCCRVPLPWGMLQPSHGERGSPRGAQHERSRGHRLSAVFDPYNSGDAWRVAVRRVRRAVPDLTATMATALLVPVTFFMAPIPAIAAIVTGDRDGDLLRRHSGCLLRMPGTPASAAYTDEAYAMTRKGQAESGAGRGPGVLGDRRPVRHRGADRVGADAGRVRAEVQLVRVLLAGADGLTCAVFIHRDRPLKGLISLFSA